MNTNDITIQNLSDIELNAVSGGLFGLDDIVIGVLLYLAIGAVEGAYDGFAGNPRKG